MSFKALLILAFILFYSITYSYSQDENKLDFARYKILLPDYVKLQFAGGIGFLSTGIGYTFFKQKLDVSFFYGYVPEYFTADDLHGISFQLTAKLFKFKAFKNIEILPLNLGWFAHHTFGNEFWVTLPDNYPDNYYWWSPGRIAGVFIGGEIKTKLFANITPASGTAFYARIGTRGLYLASKFENSSIPITDIIELGFGVAVYR
ncbi:MAG: hypothetical protein GQ564_13365 [Bacteroidales bacterium]|nr:hypothetical protein [Bacteroidales bacterium]